MKETTSNRSSRTVLATIVIAAATLIAAGATILASTKSPQPTFDIPEIPEPATRERTLRDVSTEQSHTRLVREREAERLYMRVWDGDQRYVERLLRHQIEAAGGLTIKNMSTIKAMIPTAYQQCLDRTGIDRQGRGRRYVSPGYQEWAESAADPRASEDCRAGENEPISRFAIVETSVRPVPQQDQNITTGEKRFMIGALLIALPVFTALVAAMSANWITARLSGSDKSDANAPA